MKNIVIIGGGIGGIGTALELAEAGHKVTILEKRKKCLDGSSDDTPCRLGLGFHYSDFETAKRYLHATISVLKKYPGFIVAGDEKPNHPLRRGRYFITNDSIFKSSEILGLYEKLRDEYSRLIAADETNKLFGEPEDFFRELSLDEYQGDVNPKKVKIGIETAEQILDWPRFKVHLLELIGKKENITLITEAEVCAVDHHPNDFGYTVQYRHEGKVESLEAEVIVNAAWERVEAIDFKAGFFNKPHTKRLKVIAETRLPKALQERVEGLNSMFFCFGSHASLNVVSKDRAFLSYEPTTNIEANTGLTLAPLSQRLLYGSATKEEESSYGDRIIAGASEYIPALKGAKVVGVKFGIVKTVGTYEADLPHSDYHKRNSSGTAVQQFMWFDNSCMKLLYFVNNAKEILAMLNEHIKLEPAISSLVTELSSKTEQTAIRQSLRKGLCQRYLSLPDIGEEKSEIAESKHHDATSKFKKATSQKIFADICKAMFLKPSSEQLCKIRLKKDIIEPVAQQTSVEVRNTPRIAPT